MTVNTVTNPIWVIKTRLQLQNAVTGVAYSGAMDCVRKVWQQEGLAGLYKGLFASYLGSSPTIITFCTLMLAGISETAIQFTIYERLKATLQRQKPAVREGKMHYRDGAICSFRVASTDELS